MFAKDTSKRIISSMKKYYNLSLLPILGDGERKIHKVIIGFTVKLFRLLRCWLRSVFLSIIILGSVLFFCCCSLFLLLLLFTFFTILNGTEQNKNHRRDKSFSQLVFYWIIGIERSLNREWTTTSVNDITGFLFVPFPFNRVRFFIGLSY